MTRLNAAGIHILISFFIVATALAIMYWVWYPKEYFILMGGQKLIILLSSVDVLIGPLLTFLVFKSGKKSLKFDLICIGLVQISALCYGGYVMFESRPVFTVFNKDKFQISAVVDIAPEELAKAKRPEWRHLSIAGPELVAIGIPDAKDRKETMFAKIESASAYRYPRLFEQYKKHREEVIKSGKSLALLASFSKKNKAVIDKFVSNSNRPENDYLYLPITSELAAMSVIVDAKTGEFIEIIDARQNKKLSP